MTPRALAQGLAAYGVLVLVAACAVHGRASLDPGGSHPIVASVWQSGRLVAREVLEHEDERPESLKKALAVDGAVLVDEVVSGTSWVAVEPAFVFSASFVSGHDGVVATYRSETAYVTPSDLLSHQAYDPRDSAIAGIHPAVGADPAVIWGLLAERLRTSVAELKANAIVRRARFVRTVPGRRDHNVTADSLSTDTVRQAVVDLARYLARGVDADGHYRYLIDARTNETLAGYDWTRHAGTTYFLAQAAAFLHEPTVADACMRAAARMRSSAMGVCGQRSCAGVAATDDRAELGASALSLLAFAEIVRTGLDPSYRPLVDELARFLRESQRGDGEFMHEYNRVSSRPVDVQYLYYSGEATLALARAHDVTENAADLEAARRGLSHLVGPAWRFFGSRYYFGEEHWTCQAMAALWERSPDAQALDFCVRWQRYEATMQSVGDRSAHDEDGAFGVGPMVTPQLVPVASRCEAGLATFGVLRDFAGAGMRNEVLAMDAQLRRSIALLVRRQFRPGPTELFADPAAVYGAMPASETDLTLRIDYAQHAGSAMLRWLGCPA